MFSFVKGFILVWTEGECNGLFPTRPKAGWDMYNHLTLSTGDRESEAPKVP